MFDTKFERIIDVQFLSGRFSLFENVFKDYPKLK